MHAFQGLAIHYGCLRSFRNQFLKPAIIHVPLMYSRGLRAARPIRGRFTGLAHSTTKKPGPKALTSYARINCLDEIARKLRENTKSGQCIIVNNCRVEVMSNKADAAILVHTTLLIQVTEANRVSNTDCETTEHTCNLLPESLQRRSPLSWDRTLRLGSSSWTARILQMLSDDF